MRYHKAIAGIGLALAVLVGGSVRAAEMDDALRAARYGDVGPIGAALGDIRNPAIAALAKLELAAAEFDAPKVRADLAVYLGSGDPDPVRKARAWALATSVSFASGDYAAAADSGARWCAALKRADPWREAADAAQEQALAVLLAKAPPMTVTAASPTTVATSRDAAGLIRATAAIDGLAQSSVLDTGADMSTISASAAARLHLRMIDGDASVSSATRQAVPIRVGIADKLELAGFTFRNVPFLVLDDSQLRIPLANGYSIDAIIGAPIFRAMGSVTFAEGSFTPGLPTDPAHSSALRFGSGALYVALRVGPVPLALHLDTGASASSLSPEFARAHPVIVAGLPQFDEHVAGAGGVNAVKTVHWRDVPVVVGGAAATLPDLAIVLHGRAGADWTLGSIGQDLLGRFRSYTIDFRAMRFAVTPR